MTEISKMSDHIPVRREPAAKRGVLNDEQIDSLESWLDSRFAVPGTGLRIGLDGLLGLIPGIGDTVTAGLSAIKSNTKNVKLLKQELRDLEERAARF